jgi:hypothetical protein
MSHVPINPPPTPYPALNAVLEYLVAHVRELLGSKLIGVYLQGSFALGSFDDTSRRRPPGRWRRSMRAGSS